MEENVYEIYDQPFNGLIAKKKYAPVVTSILKAIHENKEPIPIQSALEILEDSKRILLRIKNV